MLVLDVYVFVTNGKWYMRLREVMIGNGSIGLSDIILYTVGQMGKERDPQNKGAYITESNIRREGKK